jgi:hypothetical protein
MGLVHSSPYLEIYPKAIIKLEAAHCNFVPADVSDL